MSGSAHSPEPPANDPSMDDILASIRKILNEEDGPAAHASPPDDDGGILQLGPEMMVSGVEGPVPPPPPILSEAREGPVASSPIVPPPVMPPPVNSPPELVEPPPSAPVMPSRIVPAAVMPEPAVPALPAAMPVPVPTAVVPHPVDPPPVLVAPAAAAAAAQSVEALMRTLASERSTVVHRGGPTIEDLVREEMRPLLKTWLDEHLPPMVERLVRAEIERVMSRTS